METILQNTRKESRIVPFRQMIENFHVFFEDLNLSQAQHPTRTHDTKLRYTKEVTPASVTIQYQCKDMVITLSCKKMEKGGMP